MASMRVWTEGGGARALGGLPPLLFGLAFAALGVLGMRGVLGPELGPTAPPLVAFVAVGLLFALVGAGTLLGRSGVDLDPARRTVTTWRGLLVLPLVRRPTPVPDPALVTLERAQRRRGKATITVFPVSVSAPGGGATRVAEPLEHALARRLAEQVGRAFGADVEDRTLDPPSRRRPDELDLSLRRRLRREPPPPPTRPAAPKCTYVAERRRAVVDVPPALPSAAGLVRGGAGCLGGAGLVPLVIAALAGAPVALVLVAAGLWALAVVSGARRLLHLVGRLCGPIRLEVGPDDATVVWAGVNETEAVPLDDLEEVALAGQGPLGAMGPGARLLLLTDARTLDVGLGLERAEAEWLRDLVVYVAATGEPPPDGA